MLSSVKNLHFFASCFILMVLALPARAQRNEPPSGQFGVGIFVSSVVPNGLEGTYAINQNLQVGSALSLSVASASGLSSTTFLFGPFVRYQFSSSVSPFVQGGIDIVTGPAANTNLFMGGGIAYYLNHEIGVNAAVDLLDLFFSPSLTIFGFGQVRVGADWFF